MGETLRPLAASPFFTCTLANSCQPLSGRLGWGPHHWSQRLEAPCRQPWPPWQRSVRSSPLSSLDPWRSPLGSSHLFSQRQRTDQCPPPLMMSPTSSCVERSAIERENTLQ